jgi:hypothetical protein
MAIDDLIAVVPPPERPDQSGSLDDLANCEREMGITLPTDYREFAVRFGSGWFLDTYVAIANPFVLDLVKATQNRGCCEEDYKSGVVPWLPYPATPGLLELGSNENGNRLLFLVKDKPDSWPVIVVPHGAGKGAFERWDLPFGTFMAKALLNEINTAAVHACGEPVQPDERRFKQCSEIWDLRDGRWVRKSKRRKSQEKR